jgi:hypothetical protein
VPEENKTILRRWIEAILEASAVEVSSRRISVDGCVGRDSQEPQAPVSYRA